MEAVSVLGMVTKIYKDLPMEAVKNLVDSLLDSYSVQASKVSCYTDPWSCIFCSSVLEDPVTLICGHSCCKKCLLRDITGLCKKCKLKYVPIEEDPIDVEPYIKVFYYLLIKPKSFRNNVNSFHVIFSSLFYIKYQITFL